MKTYSIDAETKCHYYLNWIIISFDEDDALDDFCHKTGHKIGELSNIKIKKI